MKTTKLVVTWGLLGFVAVAVGTAVIKQMPWSPVSGRVVSETGVVPEIREGVIVMFYHGTARCLTCSKIENYAHAALQQALPSELQSGQVHWSTANYEAPENYEVVTEHEVHSSSVVLMRIREGQTIQWRNLEQVWALIGNEAEFKDYIVKQTRQMLAEQG